MNIDAIQWNSWDISAKNLAILQRDTILQCQNVSNLRRSTRELVYSHTTALELMGIELPRLLPKNGYRSPSRGRLDIDAVHVSMYKRVNRSQVPGVCFHAWKHEASIATVVGNVRCLSPVDVWKQLSPFVSLEELVALGDSMMRKDPRLKRVGLNDFRVALQKDEAFHGRSLCRRAMKLMRENTDSSTETRTRLLLDQHGFKNPLVNFEIFDPEEGRTYIVDIAYPEFHLIIEYDGRHHSDSRQWNIDVAKRGRLRDMGWIVIEVRAEHLRNEASRAQLVASILAQLGDPRLSGGNVKL
jgi:very-short-patch-repair endonuclease